MIRAIWRMREMVAAIAFTVLGIVSYAAAQWWPVEWVLMVQCFALAIGWVLWAALRALAENPFGERR